MIKLIAAAAALSMMAGGAAFAGDYGYGGDDGFTIAGAHAGVTVLGFSLGGGARLRFGGGGGYQGGGYQGGGQEYAPPPPYQEQGYQEQGYGAYYSQPAYAAPITYPPVIYQQPIYPPVYSYAAPCGCMQAYGYAY